mmetsp:Transcript_46397/g.84936  ORF Transcript_46397/g.84936 Transcript_46397/m.84936 type:complete len:270 (+) Transcript_46397:84-893(+)
MPRGRKPKLEPECLRYAMFGGPSTAPTFLSEAITKEDRWLRAWGKAQRERDDALQAAGERGLEQGSVGRGGLARPASANQFSVPQASILKQRGLETPPNSRPCSAGSVVRIPTPTSNAKKGSGMQEGDANAVLLRSRTSPALKSWQPQAGRIGSSDGAVHVCQPQLLRHTEPGECPQCPLCLGRPLSSPGVRGLAQRAHKIGVQQRNRSRASRDAAPQPPAGVRVAQFKAPVGRPHRQDAYLAPQWFDEVLDKTTALVAYHNQAPLAVA